MQVTQQGKGACMQWPMDAPSINLHIQVCCGWTAGVIGLGGGTTQIGMNIALTNCQQQHLVQ